MKMKKTFLLSALAFVAMLASCTGESKQEYKVLGIQPLVTGYHMIYADQMLDSVTVSSSRSWTTVFTQDWLYMDAADMNVTVPADVILQKVVKIHFEPNHTGKVRIAQMQVDNKDHQVGRLFAQTAWHNIIEPSVSFTDWEKMENPSFQLLLSKGAQQKTIIFTVYSAETTLSCDADWLTPEETIFAAGQHSVQLEVEANETSEMRTANITLTSSNGISTTIKVTQEP